MASFPKDHRLLDSKDFSYLKSGSGVCNTPFLRFYFKDNRLQKPHSRLGLSVSKKVGNAVQRNLVKRVLRELFRQGDVPGFGKDVLVIASPRLKGLFKDRSEVVKAVVDSWKKAEGKLREAR